MEPIGEQGVTPLVTIAQARALCSVARTHSYARTAEELGAASATSVYHLIRRMEMSLGHGSLVAASSRKRVELTPEGAEILKRADRYVNAYDALTSNRRGVRFSAYPSVAGRVIPAISRFLAEHDDAVVDFYEISDRSRADRGRALVDRTEDEEIDLVVAPSGYGRAGLSERKLYSWTLRVVLSEGDPRSHRQSVTLDQLRDLRVIVAPAGHYSRQLFDEADQLASDAPRIAMEVSDPTVMNDMAQLAPGYAAILPDDSFAHGAVEGPRLRYGGRKELGGAYSVYHLRSHLQARERSNAPSTERSRRSVLICQLADALVGHFRSHVDVTQSDRG